eukprot:TRINITY_DN5853_c0_g1_i2.p1 TRINITY_DN5853_c0_g1~~TRINITY_DN5853_c0_g1_i2.p1  ORF type:complete len:120 (-),score=35.34 TRINITY_DN5853_c0_g1_i2:464-823(-)
MASAQTIARILSKLKLPPPSVESVARSNKAQLELRHQSTAIEVIDKFFKPPSKPVNIENPTRVAITLIRSVEHKAPTLRGAAKALGFTKLQQTRIHKNIPETRGQIEKLIQFVKVEPLP